VFEVDGFETPGVDRYWIVLGLGDGRDTARITRELIDLHAVRVVLTEGGSRDALSGIELSGGGL
jgi:hypothetical protein